MRFLGRLFAPRNDRNRLAGQVEALERRLAALEASMKDCLDVVEFESERAARWADMQLQLRRMLGRLDAHRQRDEEKQGGENGGKDPKQLAAILRTKFPNAGG